MVDPVAEHVKVLVAAVDGGDLRGGDHGHAVLDTGAQRLVDAVHGVVVREREQLDARPRGVLHDLGGGQVTVRVQGVRLQVETGLRHGPEG